MIESTNCQLGTRSERRMFFVSSTPHRIHKTCILWLLPVITSTKIPQFWLIHLLLVLQRRTPSPRGTATRLRKERLHAGAFRLASAKKSITLQVAVFIIYSFVLRRETSHPPIPHYGGAAGERTRHVVTSSFTLPYFPMRWEEEMYYNSRVLCLSCLELEGTRVKQHLLSSSKELGQRLPWNIALSLRKLSVVVCFHSRRLTICKHSCVRHISWAFCSVINGKQTIFTNHKGSAMEADNN